MNRHKIYKMMTMPRLHKFLALATVLLFNISLRAQNAEDIVRYVDPTVTPEQSIRNDGKSWASAKRTIQDAIFSLNTYLTTYPNVKSANVYVKGFENGDQDPTTWYTPTAQTNTSETGTLYMAFKIYSGIHVYGGFKGDEVPTSEVSLINLHDLRKVKGTDGGYITIGELKKGGLAKTRSVWDFQYKTVLSGNLGSTKATMKWNATTNRYDTKLPSNSYHVVWFTNGEKALETSTPSLNDHYGALKNPASLDGCIITGGNAATTDLNTRRHSSFGGGVYMVAGATLANCEVRDCESALRGGGVYMDGGGHMEYCHVYRCQSLGQGIVGGYGGGVCIDHGGTIIHSFIERNSARIGGGLAILHDDASMPSGAVKTAPFDPYATTTIVSNNTSQTEAGGIVLFGGGTLNQMTITKNSCVGQDVTYSGRRYGRSGGLYIDEAGICYNSVIWGNVCKANNDIQYASNYTSGKKIGSKTFTPIVHYTGLENNDITNFSGTTHDNIYTISKNNKPADGEETRNNNYACFQAPTSEAGSYSSADPFDIIGWKPETVSDLDLKGVQLSSATNVDEKQYIMQAQDARDIVSQMFEPLSTLGAFTVDKETIKAALVQSQYSKDGGKPIPTIFIDANRALNTSGAEMGASWEKPLANIPAAINYFNEHITNKVYDVDKGELHTYTFTFAKDGFDYTGNHVQILVKQGDYINAGPSSYLQDDEGVYRLSTAALRPNTGMRLIGAYDPDITGTTVGQEHRNPQKYASRITANVLNSTYDNNSSHVVALVNVSHTYMDGFVLADGNANQKVRDAESAEPYGGGVLVNNKMEYDKTHRCNMYDNVMKNCVIVNCTGTLRGAGVYVNGFYLKNNNEISHVEFEMENCIVSNNTTVRKKLADGTWEDPNTHAHGTRQVWDLGGVIHANGDAKLTINHCTIVQNAGYGIASSSHVGGTDDKELAEEDERYKSEIIMNNTAIYANCNIPSNNLSIFGQPDYGDSNIHDLDHQRRTKDGKLMTYFATVVCPDSWITGVNNIVDKNYEPDSRSTLLDTHKTLDTDPNNDQHYAAFANPSTIIGAVENTAEITLYGGTADWTPLDMNPIVNMAVVAPANPTEDAHSAYAIETGGTDIVGNTRNYGGQGDVGAVENTDMPEYGSVYYVRMAEPKDGHSHGKNGGICEDGHNHDGLSWQTAFATISYALEVAKGKTLSDGTKPKIYVAAGTYKENIKLDATHSGINVYGGFKAYGNPAYQKDDEWDISNLDTLYQTIIDGGMQGRVINQTAGLSTKTVWEGFTIEHGMNVGAPTSAGAETDAPDYTPDPVEGKWSKGATYNADTHTWTEGTYGEKVVETVIYSEGKKYTNTYAKSGIIKGVGAFIQGNMVLKNCMVRDNYFYGNSNNQRTIDFERYGKTTVKRVLHQKETATSTEVITPLDDVVTTTPFYRITSTPTGGTAGGSGGSGIYMGYNTLNGKRAYGIVENCIIRNNHALIQYGTTGISFWGCGVYAEGGKLVNSLIVENETYGGSNILGAGLFTDKDAAELYHCTIAYNVARNVGTASAPCVWDNYGNPYNKNTNPWSRLDDDQWIPKAAKFYNCIFWGNYAYGNTGENFNAVARSGWQYAIGVPGFLSNCYHSVPVERFAMEGTTKPYAWDASYSSLEITEEGKDLVFCTGTMDSDTYNTSSYVIDDKKYSTNNYKRTNDYLNALLMKDLFNESLYPHVNTRSINDYSINALCDLADHVINMGDDSKTTEMEQIYGIDEDIAGAERTQDCMVDKGAYEYNGSGAINPDVTTEAGKAIYYVTYNGHGNTNASTPATAACWEKLQKVLDAAGRYKYQNPGTQVVVKLATEVISGKTFGYMPRRSTTYDKSATEDPRDWSIQIPRGVELWGGYTDTDDDPAEEGGTAPRTYKKGFLEKNRNILKNKTKLSGQFQTIGRNAQDAVAYHVVTFTDYVFDEYSNPKTRLLDDGITYEYVKMSEKASQMGDYGRAILDGIFIEDGNASGSTDENKRGGAAVVTEYAQLRNCVVQNNSATNEGGGLYMKPQSIVNGSIIQKNSANLGGGVYVEEPEGGAVATAEGNVSWAFFISNTVVDNTASTRGGGIYFNSNVRSYSSVYWNNHSNDQSNLSGVTDVTGAQTINQYPVDYCAVQDIRIPGINNLLLSPESTKGTRWVKDENLSAEDQNNDNKDFSYYYIMKSSILARAGMPYSSYKRMLTSGYISLGDRDINGVKRMEEDLKGDRTTMYNQVNDKYNIDLITKKNDFIEIGARAINETFEVNKENIMTRLFVMHTNDLNTEAAVAFQSMEQKSEAGLTGDDLKKVQDENKLRAFYTQVGSSMANPFTRVDDALRYIINARKEHADLPANSPQSFKTGKEKVKDVRFEVYISGGTFYPQYDQYGEQGSSRNNTFLVPEAVTIVGGTKPSLGTDNNTFYCQFNRDEDGNPAHLATSDSDYLLSTDDNAYHLISKKTNDIREERPLYDLNHNSIVEPWEMQNQTILSGASAGGGKGVYHVVTVSGDPQLVGAQPTRYTDDAMTEANKMDDDADYDKMEALNEDRYAGKESVKSLNSHDVFLDGLTITGGYAAEYASDDTPNRNDFWRGGGVLVNGNRYVKADGSTKFVKDYAGEYAGWDSEKDAMEQGDRLIHLNVTYCEFIDNTGHQGGALYSNGNVVVTSSSFLENKSLGVNSDDIDKNYVTYSGGGAVAVSGRFNAANCLFANNEATRGNYDIKTAFTENVTVSGTTLTYNRPTNSGNYADTKLVRHALCDVVHGFGGALWGNDLSKVVVLNCDFVRNKAFAFPCVFVTHNNAEWKGYFDAFKDIDYVRHYATNTLFWGNDISAKKALDTDKLEDYYYAFNSWYTYDTPTEIQAMYFCAYEDGWGPAATEDTGLDKNRAKTREAKPRSYYQNIGYTEKVGLWESMGYANHNVILNGDNDALDGPNFMQPSTSAGIEGYLPSANWLTYRINSLVDNGWTALKLGDDGGFVYEKDQYGETSSNDAYPDAPDDAVAGGAMKGDKYKEGDYMWRARLFKDLSGLDMLPIGDEKYMYYAKADGSENTKRPMRRVSRDPISRSSGKTYIDIGVYEYQHAELNLGSYDDIDVMWVAQREDPFAGNDGRTFDTPTSDLQRAIEMLLLSRCDHPKELRIKEGSYTPTYQLDDGNFAFNIHLGDNHDYVALKKGSIPSQRYGIQSLTIKGGYSNVAEGDWDPEAHKTIMTTLKRSDADAKNNSHIFYILDTEQWLSWGEGSSTKGEGYANKYSQPAGYALPIIFDGLTFTNPEAVTYDENKGGAAIYYKEQYQTLKDQVTVDGIKVWQKSDIPLGQAMLVGVNKTTTPWTNADFKDGYYYYPTNDGEQPDASDLAAYEENQIIRAYVDTDPITPTPTPKLTIKNCIFRENGKNGETEVPAVKVEQGGGEALIYNSLFHDNTGNPVVGVDTKMINVTSALNGNHTILTNSGQEYKTAYKPGNVGKWYVIESNQDPSSGATTLPNATFKSEFHNNLVWKDAQATKTTTAGKEDFSGTIQFSVVEAGVEKTQKTDLTGSTVITHNAVTGITNDNEALNGANVSLNDDNMEAKTGPNFMDPDNIVVADRNFHLDPSVPVVNKADMKIYLSQAKHEDVTGKSSLYMTRLLDGYSATDLEGKTEDELKALKETDDYERDLGYAHRLIGDNIDRGAYECTAYMNRVFYVDPQQSLDVNQRNGTSWAYAYGIEQLKKAIDAAGVYSSLNNGTPSFVFVKANSDQNAVADPVTIRAGVMLYGSVRQDFFDESEWESVNADGSKKYNDSQIKYFVDQTLADRQGIAGKNTANTRIAGLSAYGTGYTYGSLVDGFIIRPVDKDAVQQESAIHLEDGQIVGIRNCIITGYKMTAGKPVVEFPSGLLYNTLIYGNSVNGAPVVRKGGNQHADIVNCTIVAMNSGEVTVTSEDEGNGESWFIRNTITYNEADNTLGRPDGTYRSCNEKTGMFAPYFRTTEGMDKPEHLTNHGPYWYQLHEKSECIDSGDLANLDMPQLSMKFDKTYFMDPAVDRDLLGNPRVLNGNIDKGCFETWVIKADSLINKEMRYNISTIKDDKGNEQEKTTWDYRYNYGGNMYPHIGSVVYVEEGKNLVLKEQFTDATPTTEMFNILKKDEKSDQYKYTQVLMPAYHTNAGFTGQKAFYPGYLLLKDGASLYSQGQTVGAAYVAVERDCNAGYSMIAFPYTYRWNDLSVAKYESSSDKLSADFQYNQVEGAWSYDGAQRSGWDYDFHAENSPCWIPLEEGEYMNSNVGWLMNLKIKIDNLRFTGYHQDDGVLSYEENGTDKTYDLIQYNSNAVINRSNEYSTKNYPQFTTEQNMGWNMCGVPYLVYSYRTAMPITESGAKNPQYALHIPHMVYVMDNEGSYYRGNNILARKSWEDGAYINLGHAAFAQTAVLGGTGAKETVTFRMPDYWYDKENPISSGAKQHYALAMTDADESGDEVVFDAAAEANGNLSYAYGRDGLKMPAFDEAIPQVWMQTSEGTPMSLVSEAPRESQIALGVRIPKNGEYTFKAIEPEEFTKDQKQLDAIWLIDKETGSVWNLLDGDYKASVADPQLSTVNYQLSTAITTTRFAVQLGGLKPGTNGSAKKNYHSFFVRNQTLHIKNTLDNEVVNIYQASGALVKTERATAGEYTTELTSGVYIVRISGDSYKVVVR